MQTPLVLAIKSAEESSRQKSYPGGGNSFLANTALVSSTPPYANWCTEMITTELPSSDSQLWSTNTGTPKLSGTGHLTHFRKALSNNRISEEAGELLSATWRQKTNKNCDSAWRKWESWCQERNISITSSSLNDILSFLVSQFHKGYSYISLNLYRSAISSIHDKIDGVEVGSHPLVSHLLKGPGLLI